MHVEIQQEHRWLQKFVGEWTFETEALMEPGAPPIKFKGTETVRSIGDIWVQCEGRGEMPGGGTQITIMTLGYDPSKKRFVGTFLGSMMTFLWIYDGQLDAAGKVLTLDTEGPSFSGDGQSPYRDAVEFISDDHRVLTSSLPAENGQWQRFMSAHYRRVK